MKSLIEVIDKKRIVFLECESKEKALNTLIDNLSDSSEITNKDELAQGIFHREELMSTGIGLGIAVPHVRLASVKNIVMSVGICRKAINDYETLDGQPVNFIFLIAAGIEQHEKHLKLLATISSCFKEDALREKLLKAESIEEFYSIITDKEK